MNTSRIVVTVHGIRTYGQWQTRLAALLNLHGIAGTTYRYGYFSVLAFLVPPLRWLATRRFRIELERILKRNPQVKIDLVAHSFGTHIVGFALRSLDRSYVHRIHTVLLAGSVLRADFPWSGLIEAGLVERVVNDCGIDDAILPLSQFLVLFTGMAGRVGFAGATNHQFTNRYFRGGHSHYFEVTPERDFLLEFWLPVLLIPNETAIVVDERPPLGPLQGVMMTLMQVAEPVKLLLYVGVPILLAQVFHYEPLAEARAQAELEKGRRELESLRADSERQKADAIADGVSALAEKLKSERERVEALAAKARAEATQATERPSSAE